MYISLMAIDRTYSQNTRHLSLPEGRIAYDVIGDGPLVLLVPGMGDLRSSYRFLVPALVAAGYRVATTDLRGHGDSDAGFASYGDEETAGDIAALIEELGGPAIVVGNSMGAGAAVCVAADRADLISAVVLVGPFVRDPEVGAVARIALRVAMARPWVALAWRAYAPTLYAGRKPDDLHQYLSGVIASIRRPAYAKAFSRTTRTSHAPAAARLNRITVPTLVVMGAQDPDFPDPAAEAAWVADAVAGTVAMVPDAGHYPQSQQPDAVASALLGFLDETGLHA